MPHTFLCMPYKNMILKKVEVLIMTHIIKVKVLAVIALFSTPLILIAKAVADQAVSLSKVIAPSKFNDSFKLAYDASR